MSREDNGKGMLPAREQARMALNALRWAYWPKNQPVWLNVFDLIISATGMLAVILQLWLVLLTCVVLYFAAWGIAGFPR